MSRQQGARKKSTAAKSKGTELYSEFDQLDGEHPWQTAVPEGHISYPVRELNRGKVAYFNFDLAKEMGLIPDDHPRRITKSLEEKLIKTFSIRIINEYDIENKVYYSKETIKPKKYMATRYLQLQHANKKGATSGDGRCVWNGVVKNKGSIWDVSSRGTGVTALAPGSVLAGKPLKSGSTEQGYGCGLAEIDELYSSAIMSETLHNNGFSTERMLCIVDLGSGLGIGARASKNLLRPAHLFALLKTEKHEALKSAVDYLIHRQNQNKVWDFNTKDPRRYDKMLKEVCKSFSEVSARLEREYIFTWLDWDGDNVLIDAGIIDYGSIRVFGLRHDQYRYDDDDRFSTNLNEQKSKARLIVQVFAQLVDYLKTKNKKPLGDFAQSKTISDFNNSLEQTMVNYSLYQVGFTDDQIDALNKGKKETVQSFYETFTGLERLKTQKKLGKVEDGVNRPAILDMRYCLYSIVNFYTQSYTPNSEYYLDPEELFESILAEHASPQDSKPSRLTLKRLLELQNLIHEMLSFCLPKEDSQAQGVGVFKQRNLQINRQNRITGNALVYIVDAIINFKKRGLSAPEIQKTMDQLIAKQQFSPSSAYAAPGHSIALKNKSAQKLLSYALTVIEGHKYDI